MPAKQLRASRLNCPNEGGIIVGAIVIVAWALESRYRSIG